MLIFSYILAASLEGALSYMVYTATGEIPLLYALLFISSIISIPVETSETGEAMRKKAKEEQEKPLLLLPLTSSVQVPAAHGRCRGRH